MKVLYEGSTSTIVVDVAFRHTPNQRVWMREHIHSALQRHELEWDMKVTRLVYMLRDRIPEKLYVIEWRP